MEDKSKLGSNFFKSAQSESNSERFEPKPFQKSTANVTQNGTHSDDSTKDADSTKAAEIEKAVNDLKESLVRSLAEIENLKKRQQKELESSVKFANTNILKDLTEPFEQLFMALAIKPSQDLLQDATFSSLFSGIEMTKTAFEKAFEKHGLKRVHPKGQKFDHNIHQAISQLKQDGIEAGTVIEVVQAGYILEERVIKPALVIVSA